MNKKAVKLTLGIISGVMLAGLVGCNRTTGIEISDEEVLNSIVENMGADLSESEPDSESESLALSESVAASEPEGNAGSALDESEIYANYIKFIKENFDGDTFFAQRQDSTILYSPSVAFEDINGDGCKDVLVNGYLGLRCKQFTDIYMYSNGEFVYIPEIDGCVCGIGDGIILTSDPDYGQAGAIQYLNESVYSISESGDLELKMMKSTESVVYDEATQTFDDGHPLSQTIQYFMEGAECTKEEYDAKMSSYVCTKELEYTELLEDNIESIIK